MIWRTFHISCVLLTAALAMALGACAYSSDYDDDTAYCSTGSGSGDTLTVSLNGGSSTTYTEVSASNNFGAEPVVIYQYNATDMEHEIAMGCAISGTVIGTLVRLAIGGLATNGLMNTSYSLADMNHSAAYITNYDSSNDSFTGGDDASAGTVTIANAPGVGGTLTGTFSVTSTTALTGGTAGINTMSGSFNVVREADD